jgi:hypothetical protein
VKKLKRNHRERGGGNCVADAEDTEEEKREWLLPSFFSLRFLF